MRPVFGRKLPSNPTAAPQSTTASTAPPMSTDQMPIIVPRRSFASSDDGDLVQANVNFVNALLRQGCYTRFEISQNAMRSYYVDYYLAQVNNGGNKQFVSNSGWNQYANADISEGLSLMGLDDVSRIFADLSEFVNTSQIEIHLFNPFGDYAKKHLANIEAMDRRFFHNRLNDSITPANARWLRSLPELTVVADDDYEREIITLCEANPQRAARQHERRFAAMEAALRDPLRVAARILCADADCLPVHAFGLGLPGSKAPDGRKATAWSIACQAGRRFVMLLDDVALLCTQHLSDGRETSAEIVAETERRLKAGDLGALETYRGGFTYEPVACVSIKEIHAAIAQAEAHPIPFIADLFSANLPGGGTVVDVFAMARSDAIPAMMWCFTTSKNESAAVFRTAAGWTLFDGTRTLMPMSDAEVQRLLAHAKASRR